MIVFFKTPCGQSGCVPLFLMPGCRCQNLGGVCVVILWARLQEFQIASLFMLMDLLEEMRIERVRSPWLVLHFDCNFLQIRRETLTSKSNYFILVPRVTVGLDHCWEGCFTHAVFLYVRLGKEVITHLLFIKSHCEVLNVHQLMPADEITASDQSEGSAHSLMLHLAHEAESNPDWLKSKCLSSAQFCQITVLMGIEHHG